jgi:MFS family permease
LLPASTHFKAGVHSHPHTTVWQSLSAQLKSPALLGTFVVGMNILFSLVALFTYVTFHLAAPPFSLGIETLSWLFSVYLFGAVVTPQTGKLIDKLGLRKALCGAMLISALSNYLTLIPNLVAVLCGLALSSGALFICQSATTSSLRQHAVTGTSSAAGLYVCFYYIGGSLGGYLPSLAWNFMSGGWPMCVALISGMQLVALVTALALWRKTPQQADSTR